METTNPTRWKAGDPLTHQRLNEGLDAITKATARKTPRTDAAGPPVRWARISAVTATAIVDGNANPAQWIPVIHECLKVATGYGSPSAKRFVELPDGVGYRGPAYYLTLMETDGSEVPADVKLIAPAVDDLVRFSTIEIPNADGTVTIEAIIETPLSAECA